MALSRSIFCNTKQPVSQAYSFNALLTHIFSFTVGEATALQPVSHQLKEDVCQCPKLDIESYIPTPHVDEHYNKEQWLYKDALSNFL